jgi:hypothetical protein
MADKAPPDKNRPPEISPYVVSVLLAGFGLWCLYDGWFNSSPEMAEHLTFNRVGSVVLPAWAAWDFWRVRKREKEVEEHPPPPEPQKGE